MVSLGAGSSAVQALRSSGAAPHSADAVAAGGSEALARLTEADESAISALAAANRALDAAARHSSALQPLAEEIRQSLAAVQATASELEAFLADFTADPEQLERTESRLALLERLKRKYGTDADDILAYANLLEQEQQQLQEADDNIALLENRLAELATRPDTGTLDDAVAIVSVYPFGFEGPDRRFLAVPLGE